MKRCVEVASKFVSFIAENFLKILFAIIIISMLFINSIYLYIDKPDFQFNNINNYIWIIINLLFIFALIFIFYIMPKRIKYSKIFIITVFLLYFIMEIIYIFLVPITPFSDMAEVIKIAKSNFTENIEYLQKYPNNLPICILYNLIFKVSSYNVIILKILNVICNILTIYFAYKIYENIYKNKNIVLVLLGLCSISTFLYVNCTYNDLIFVTIVMAILYLVTKEQQNKLKFLLICILSFLQYIIRPVGIILVIALCLYYLLNKRNLIAVVILVASFLILNFSYFKLKESIIPVSDQEIPIWSYIQMGINEEEFGFQDSSHSTSWNFTDYINRLKELGPKRFTKLLIKKVIWTWTEGTYQVGRYAFGNQLENQYDYETVLTKKVYNTDSKLRDTIDYAMKGQYFTLLLLSYLGMFFGKNNNDKIKLILYLVMGIFCFYVIWEIKSRYIYCLYPIFLIFATRGSEVLIEKIKKGKLKWENLKKLKLQ